jgi:hypothetical protein
MISYRLQQSALVTLLISLSFDGISANAVAADSVASGAATTDGANASAQINQLKIEQTQLRRMAESVKRTKRAGTDLIGECTQPVEMSGEIDIIGQDVIPIMPATSEGFAQNYIAPRPKYVKLHMNQLGALIPILQDDVNTLSIPDSEKAYAAQPLQDLAGYMNDLRQHYKKLLELTKTEDYDQVAICNEARGLDTSCKGIDSARKKLLHQDEKIEHQEEKIEKNESKE